MSPIGNTTHRAAMLIALAAAGSTLPAYAAGSQDRLAVLPLGSEGLSPGVVRILTDLLLENAHALGTHDVIGASDIEAMLGLEKMKDVLACDDTSCAAEIGGALGVPLLLTARVGVLGDELIITGSVIDTRRTTIGNRATVKTSNDEREYARAMQQFVRKLLGDAAGATINLDAFLNAGLSYADFEEFRASELPYRAWASERNQESWWLEISKWLITAMVPIMVGMTFDPDVRWVGVGMTLFYGSAAAGMWWWDLANVDLVPADL